MFRTNHRPKPFVRGLVWIWDDNFDSVELKKSILKAADGRNLECKSTKL